MLLGVLAGLFNMKVIAPAKRLHEAFYAMGVLAHLPGGPHHVYFSYREPAARDYYSDIQALASRMPWIRSVNRGLPPLMQFGLDLRPYPFKQDGRSMLAKMRYYCGLYEFTPWFERMTSVSEHIVVSRTLTQHNSLFPWGALLSVARHSPIFFVGTPEEYAAFSPLIPSSVTVKYPETDWGGSTLDLCLSASLFIGNQSPALAIVEGAHVPAVTEVSLSNPDNIYIRQGSSPCFSNRAIFPEEVPGLGGAEVQSSVEDVIIESYADWNPPPGGWRVECPGKATRYFDDLDSATFHKCKYSPELHMFCRDNAKRMILADNFQFYPEWAEDAIARRMFRKPTLALKLATRKICIRRFIPPVSNYLPALCD